MLQLSKRNTYVMQQSGSHKIISPLTSKTLVTQQQCTAQIDMVPQCKVYENKALLQICYSKFDHCVCIALVIG